MSEITESNEFIGKWLKLIQHGKKSNLFLKTQPGNTGAELSVRLGHVGPSKHVMSKMAQHSKDAVKNKLLQWPLKGKHQQIQLLLLRTLLKKKGEM